MTKAVWQSPKSGSGDSKFGKGSGGTIHEGSHETLGGFENSGRLPAPSGTYSDGKSSDCK
jgi:hypothetical protein